MRMMNNAGHLRADSPFRDVVAEVAYAQRTEGQAGILQHLEDFVHARVCDGVVPEVIGSQLFLQLGPNPLDSLGALAIETRVSDEAASRPSGRCLASSHLRLQDASVAMWNGRQGRM